MALTPGTRLGVYEVTARIGEGGMGQVYRARDTKLNRDVAVKILPGNFADDPDRLARFTREAQTLASLNHLNIAHIHGIEESGGVRALVLELVEGEDLAERLARGPIPLDEALPIARQIAEALEAAHEQGIIHRDLKPANIKVRADGTVKVLDFGLAKAMEPAGLASPSLAHSPTITTPAHLRQAYGGQAMTQAGIILGTAAYMAPEQARGKGVDKRADVWAFGVVLYEMLTGRSLFKGDTVTDVLAAVVTREPDWTALPAGVPSAVRRLLRRCIDKDPRLRLRDIGDARIELTARVDSDMEAQPASVPPARRSRRSWMWIAGMAAAAVVGTVVGRLAFRPPPVESPLVSFELSVPDVPAPAISPDGSRIAFTSGGRLHVRELGRLTATDLPGTEGANSPFWSHDSTTIGFGANGKLWRISAAGGPPAVICNLPTTTWDDDAGGAWLPDGTIVFTTGGSS